MNIFKFLKEVGKSKKIRRTGWVREKVKNPESVADHCFRLIVLSMVIAPILKLNQEKLIKMAIVHDLGETKTGDIVSERWGKVDFELGKKKEKMEKEAIDEIFEGFIKQKEYADIFEERVELKTKESKISRQLDKLEMAMQAFEYEEEQDINLTEFIEDAKANIDEPVIKRVLEEIERLRKRKF